MILTCPACDTKYVVKDSAIPPEGRQVRCASCKHSWHQDPEKRAPSEDAEAEAPFVSFGGPPRPNAAAVETPVSEPSAQTGADQFVSEAPEPAIAAEVTEAVWDERNAFESDAIQISEENAEEAPDEVEAAAPPAAEDERVVETDWNPVADGAPQQPDEADRLVAETATHADQWAADDEVVGYQDIDDDDEPSSRRWVLLLGLIAVLAVAAAAFWLYAPAQWREKAGIAQTGETPLKLMITSNDRQELASGNELLAVSGRVINPTDQEQDVPPIKAELRNKDTKQVVHRWTIAPPARVLAPRSSASFNSAEVDIPSGGDELVVTLGG